jgi:hypothetical protein
VVKTAGVRDLSEGVQDRHRDVERSDLGGEQRVAWPELAEGLGLLMGV